MTDRDLGDNINNVCMPLYAKTDEIAEKVGKVFDRIIADKGGDDE